MESRMSMQVCEAAKSNPDQGADSSGHGLVIKISTMAENQVLCDMLKDSFFCLETERKLGNKLIEYDMSCIPQPHPDAKLRVLFPLEPTQANRRVARMEATVFIGDMEISLLNQDVKKGELADLVNKCLVGFIAKLAEHFPRQDLVLVP